MPRDNNIDGEVLFELAREVIERRFQELYRGRETLRILKPYIGIDGVMGFTGSIVKKDPRDGSFRVVEIELSVLDDLGHPLHNIEDLGGKCLKGEIAKVGHIFQCMDCNDYFCDIHIRFLGRNRQTPLCLVDGEGCFKPYMKVSQRMRQIERQRLLIEEETRLAMALEGQFLSMKSAEQAKVDYRNGKNGFLRGLFFRPSGISIRCPSCGFSPSYYPVECKSCGQHFELRGSSPRTCPRCGTAVKQVPCYRCPKLIDV
ncbi:MAG: hypothetical protein WCO26_00600 [Deltaproteobacteria bacterium]